jgi:Putative MetA-pathway of phenol degradation
MSNPRVRVMNPRFRFPSSLRPAWRPLAVGFVLLGFLLARPLVAQVTESPQTIAPGKFLLKMDALSLSFDRHETDEQGVKFTAVGVGRAFLATGLTQDLDVQVGAELFLHTRVENSGTTQSHSGTCDIYFRTKWTFWRDQSLGASAAIMPYIKVPTSSGGVGNGFTEGGVIVPWAMALGGGFTAGAMAEWDILRNDANNGYDSHWYTSGVFSRAITQTIAIYGESTLTATSAGISRTALTVGGGVNYNLSQFFVVDYAFYAGLSRGAAAWNPVVRIRWEF